MQVVRYENKKIASEDDFVCLRFGFTHNLSYALVLIPKNLDLEFHEHYFRLLTSADVYTVTRVDVFEELYEFLFGRIFNPENFLFGQSVQVASSILTFLDMFMDRYTIANADWKIDRGLDQWFIVGDPIIQLDTISYQQFLPQMKRLGNQTFSFPIEFIRNAFYDSYWHQVRESRDFRRDIS